MCPNELVAVISALAIGLAEGRAEEYVELLAVFFTQLGDTLATIALRRRQCESPKQLCE